MASIVVSADGPPSTEAASYCGAKGMAASSSLLADGLGAVGERFVFLAHHARRKLDYLLPLRDQVLQRQHLHLRIAIDVVGQVGDGVGRALPLAGRGLVP